VKNLLVKMVRCDETDSGGTESTNDPLIEEKDTGTKQPHKICLVKSKKSDGVTSITRENVSSDASKNFDEASETREMETSGIDQRETLQEPVESSGTGEIETSKTNSQEDSIAETSDTREIEPSCTDQVEIPKEHVDNTKTCEMGANNIQQVDQNVIESSETRQTEASGGQQEEDIWSHFFVNMRLKSAICMNCSCQFTMGRMDTACSGGISLKQTQEMADHVKVCCAAQEVSALPPHSSEDMAVKLEFEFRMMEEPETALRITSVHSENVDYEMAEENSMVPFIDEISEEPEIKPIAQDTPLPFKCKTCDRRFMCSSSLTAHEKRHKIVNRFNLKQTLRFLSSKKKFKCNKCDKSFKGKRHLHQHQKMHGPKSFACQHCDKRFHWKSSLDSHLKTHKNMTPSTAQTLTNVTKKVDCKC